VTFRDDLERAAAWADDYLSRVGTLPVGARVEPGHVRKRLPDSPPEQPEPFEALLRDLDEVIVPGLTHWNHPRFFAWFPNTGSAPGVLAELLIAALNVNNMTWLASPAATELELTVMDWLAQLLVLPRDWHGHIEDSASTATVAALAAARTRRPGGIVYASEQANFSVEKAARLVGLEFRAVAVDDEFRMLADAPFDDATAIVATVGTTGTTSVDPVRELARRCAGQGAWLHVDAAYAGAAAICPELRWCLDGIELADSVVVNPHKWLFTPMDCSAFWTRRPEALHAAFALVPDYLAATPDAVDLKDFGPALGRRFRALKLWAVLRWYGAEGLRSLIREHVRLAQLFASLVEAEPGWEVVAPHPFSTVCFRHVEADNDELARAATATGELFVASSRLRGRPMIRLAIGNEQTTEDDIRRSWEVLRACAARQ
jgi:aromatic-L-amino-acid decarboxylase